MNQPSLTPAQMNAVLQYASARLGVPPEQLAKMVSSGGYEGLASSLSPENQEKLRSLVGDRAKAEAMLNSPQLRQLLSQFHDT